MFYCSFVSIHYIICECGDTFPTEDALKEHLEKDHHPLVKIEKKDEYACETCQKVFSSERACLIHQRVHQPIRPRIKDAEEKEKEKKPQKKYYNIKNIVCEVCGKRYASNAALGYHQRVHTGERPYQCSMCPKNFTMPLFLQIHMRTHTGERPYECPHCPKAFSNKAALLRHDRVHTGVKPYECPKCGKFFTQSNSMKLHVKTVHLKQPAPYKSKSRRAKQLQRAKNPMEVSVKVQSGAVKVEMPEIKSEAEAECLADVETYHVYYDGDMYQNAEEFYQEVEIGHPEITMYEVEDQENSEVMYNVEDIKNEILYEVQDEKGEILYEDGQRAEILYEDGQTAEILYEGDDRSDIHYEEVYEEAI